MFSSVKDRTLWLYANLRGWRTRRKLVIFESDDWGAIRMPGRRAYDALLAAGIRVDRSAYDRLDCLERREDLNALFQVLSSHHDAGGRPARFTFNTVMGNPDFDAIRRDCFEHFHHQHMFESYRDYHGDDLEPVWREAIRAQLIQPQFHAREHLNAPLWMRDLKSGLPETQAAFEHRFYGLKTRTSSPYQKNYLAAYWPDSPLHMEQINEIAADGLSMFERTFGYRSSTLVACNYVWPHAIEGRFADLGVKLLQSQRAQIEPQPARQGATHARRHYTGQKSPHGLRYSVRNVLFEPYLDPHRDWCARALEHVGAAFQLGKPAVVCTHRINYVGGMDAVHRDRSLAMLGRFLDGLRRRWPDIEFISSDELACLMEPAKQ